MSIHRNIIAIVIAYAAIVMLSQNNVVAAAISYVGISNDSDCNISASKTYTHKLDFGSGTPGALINGVQFDATSSDPQNFSRTVSSGTEGVSAGNTPPGVSGNLTNLMRDMYYNGNNDAGGITTWTLMGLTAGVTYDARIYTRHFTVNSNRLATIAFDADGTGSGSDVTGVISEDAATSVGMAADTDPYYINYRFTAVSGEDLVITVTQQNVNASWHLYGISCEVLEPTPITFLPADNANGVLTSDDLVVAFDMDIVKASGNITLKKISDDSVVEILDVNSAAVTILGAEATINPSNDLERGTGYYVQIDAGAFEDTDSLGSNLAITDSTAWNFTTVPEILSFVHITNDADCGIMSNKNYTHKLDFGLGTPGALINGVQFDATSSDPLNFSRTVSSGTSESYIGNTPTSVSGNLSNLMRDMYFNGECTAGGTTTWTLKDLTPGYKYETRIYTRQWDPGTRICSMVFDPDGAGPISDPILRIFEDDATTVGMDAAADAYYISYPFTAVEGEDLVITVTQYAANGSWHLYGITNELIPPAGTIILIQ